MKVFSAASAIKALACSTRRAWVGSIIALTCCRVTLHTTHPAEIAAYLYSDENVAQRGHPGMGLSPYAGFEIAYRLIKQMGLPVRTAILLPTAEIIENARLETLRL